MEVRRLQLMVRGFGAKPTVAAVELDVLTRTDRFKRAGMALGAGLVAALIALPIPLVHFVFVPAALAAGIVVGTLRLRQQDIFGSARGACPYCGTEQNFTVMGRFRLPKKMYCVSCHRQLMLENTTT